MDPAVDFEIEEEVDYDLDDDFLDQGFEEEEEEKRKQAQAKAEADAQAAIRAAESKSQAVDSSEIAAPAQANRTETEDKVNGDKTEETKTGPRKRVPIPIPPKSFSKSVNPLDKDEPKASAGNARVSQALGGGWGQAQRGRGGRTGGRGSEFNQPNQNAQYGGRGDQGGRGFRPRPPSEPYNGMLATQMNPQNTFQNMQKSTGGPDAQHRSNFGRGGPNFQFAQNQFGQHSGMQLSNNFIPQWGMGQQVQRPTPGFQGNNTPVVHMRMSGGLPAGSGPMMLPGGLPMPPNMAGMLLGGGKAKSNPYAGLDDWSPEDSNKVKGRAAELAKQFPLSMPQRQSQGNPKSFFAHGMEGIDLLKSGAPTRRNIANRLSVVPRLAGDLDEEPKRGSPVRRQSPLRANGGIEKRAKAERDPVKRLPPPMPPKETPEEKLRKQKAEEEAAERKAAIAERIRLQRLENALIKKAEALKKEKELADLQKQIAKLEAEKEKREKEAETVAEAPKPVAQPAAVKSVPSPKRKAEAETVKAVPSKRQRPSSDDSEEEAIDLPKQASRGRSQPRMRSEERDWRKSSKADKSDRSKSRENNAVPKGDLRELLLQQRAKRKGLKDSTRS